MYSGRVVVKPKSKTGRKNARKIDQSRWNQFKPEIERLFLEEKRKLKSLDGECVIEIMRKRHNFVAT
jgi:hypothetical protein